MSKKLLVLLGVVIGLQSMVLGYKSNVSPKTQTAKPTKETKMVLKDLRFIQAAKTGDIYGIQKGLENGADINAKEKIYGNTALMWASIYEYTKIAEFLINMGADINAKNKYGNTALVLAILNGQPETAKLLIDAGADVNVKNKDGLTALMYISSGIYELSKLNKKLIDAKDNYEDTALMDTSSKIYEKYEIYEIVALLINAGADVNAKNIDGYTALMYASGVGYTEIAEFLIKAGADVNAKTKDGETALMRASKYGHTKIVDLLKNAGAEE